jgi:hypothetical protein
MIQMSLPIRPAELFEISRQSSVTHTLSNFIYMRGGINLTIAYATSMLRIVDRFCRSLHFGSWFILYPVGVRETSSCFWALARFAYSPKTTRNSLIVIDVHCYSLKFIDINEYSLISREIHLCLWIFLNIHWYSCSLIFIHIDIHWYSLMFIDI